MPSPSLPSRRAGTITQGRSCQGGRCRACWECPHASSATQSPASSWWNPVMVVCTGTFAGIPGGLSSLRSAVLCSQNDYSPPKLQSLRPRAEHPDAMPHSSENSPSRVPRQKAGSVEEVAKWCAWAILWRLALGCWLGSPGSPFTQSAIEAALRYACKTRRAASDRITRASAHRLLAPRNAWSGTEGGAGVGGTLDLEHDPSVHAPGPERPARSDRAAKLWATYGQRPRADRTK